MEGKICRFIFQLSTGKKNTNTPIGCMRGARSCCCLWFPVWGYFFEHILQNLLLVRFLWFENILNNFFSCDRNMDWFIVGYGSNFGHEIDLSLAVLKVFFLCDACWSSKQAQQSTVLYRSFELWFLVAWPKPMHPTEWPYWRDDVRTNDSPLWLCVRRSVHWQIWR
jgi:hypothetical protein